MSFFAIQKFAHHVKVEGTICYIGLGSNLQDPLSQIICATQLIDHIPKTKVLQSSSLYRSKPVGNQDQPDYLNSVLKIDTQQLPHDLLTILEYLEAEQGRINKKEAERWGPRNIDMDILLYGDEVISDEVLTIPHKELPKRSFVLKPLAELDPHLTIPGVTPTPIQAYINNLDCSDLEIVCRVQHTPLTEEDEAEQRNKDEEEALKCYNHLMKKVYQTYFLTNDKEPPKDTPQDDSEDDTPK